MSSNFYNSTRVSLDGRLLRIFADQNTKGAHSKVPFYKDPEIVEAIVKDARQGLTNAQSSELVGVSPSEVSKIRRIYRERWDGFKGVSSVSD
jgi:hypothetical protein